MEPPRPDIYSKFPNWIIQAYFVLTKFAHRLMISESNFASKFGDDISDKISSLYNPPVQSMQGLNVLAHEASDYIFNTLKGKMEILQKTNPDCVYSDDPYMNVINYFKATQGIDFLNRLTHADNNYLLDNILPWLGLHDWGSHSGGQAGQMDVFKYKLNKYLEQFGNSSSASDARDARDPLIRLVFYSKNSGGGKHRRRTQRTQRRRHRCKRTRKH